jgi:hypothetical protein
VADLSLGVLENLRYPLELSAHIGAIWMKSPAADLAQFTSNLSKPRLDIAQSAVHCGVPSEIAPPLLGLTPSPTSHHAHCPRAGSPPLGDKYSLRISEGTDIAWPGRSTVERVPRDGSGN